MFNHVPLNYELPKLIQQNIDGVRRYVTPSGLSLPSVTTVLGKSDKKKSKALYNWRKRLGNEEAQKITNNSAARGTVLHKVIEKYLNNDPDYKVGARHDALDMFYSIKPFINKIDNIHLQEARLFSERLGVAGTVDTIADYDGVLSVVDFKNARAMRTEEMIISYFLQVCAYGLMFSELTAMKIKQIVILMAVENSEAQVFIKQPINYIKPLLTAIKTYNITSTL